MAKKTFLTALEKKYVKLLFETSNNVNYDELFKKVAAELNCSEEIVRNFMDKISDKVPIKEEKSQVQLTPNQKLLRNTFNQKTSNQQTVTIFSDAAAAQIEDNIRNNSPKNPRLNKAIFRGNK